MQGTEKRQHDLPELTDVSPPVLARVTRPALRRVLDELTAPTQGDLGGGFDNRL